MDAPPVQYTRSRDGMSIAYSRVGAGRPLLYVPLVFHHLQLCWEEPTQGRWLESMASRFQLVTFDMRGTGLSQRGLSPDFSVLDRTIDVEAVVNAAGFDRFVMFAHGAPAHTAVRYAAQHPDQIEALILVSCSVGTQPWPPSLFTTLATGDWDTFLYVTSGRSEDLQAAAQAVENRRRMVDYDDFKIMVNDFNDSSIEAELPLITAPTLVIHPRELRTPTSEDCAGVAARIPNARLVTIGGGETPSLLGAPDEGIAAIDEFLSNLGQRNGPRTPADAAGARTPALDRLSHRELEVLRLLAQGKTNPEIADALFITVNTVQNHLKSIYGKVGASNRTEAAVYAQQHGLV